MAQTFTSTDVVSTTNVFADNQSQRTNENTLRSTFSGSTQPSDPVVGQQWYDTANSKTMQYNGTTWVPIDTNGTTQVDVNNAKGSLTSLTSYLRVAHNDDGTLKSSPATAIDEFKDNALVITYLSPTSFTVPSDLTSIFTANRKVKVYLSASTAISYVASSTFSTVTTVTLGSPVLDATVTAVKYSIIQKGMPQDYNLEIGESTGYGVISGCSASESNGTITVASGVTHMSSGSRYSTTATTFTPIADATNPRLDLIYLSSTGVVSYLIGSAAVNPVLPSVPADGLVLHKVSINTNGTIVLTDLRSFKARYQNIGWVNIKDFGAIGDGITDDTVAIKLAIAYSAGNDKTIIFPPGTFIVSSSINITDVTIKGLDPSLSIIKTSFAGPVFSVQKNTTIDGIGFNNSNAYCTCVYANQGARNIVIKNCYSSNSCLFNSYRLTYATGITDDLLAQNVKILNNTVVSLGDPAIYFNYVKGAVAEGNIIYGSNHGIAWWGGDSKPTVNGAVGNPRYAKNISISNNIIHDIVGGGIWGSMGDHISVQGNTVGTCAGVGIDFEGCVNCTAEGNTVKDCTTACLTTFYFCSNVVFSGNAVSQDGSKGITMYSHNNTGGYNKECSVKLCGNVFKGDGILGYWNHNDLGTIVISNNLFYNVKLYVRSTNAGKVIIEGNTITIGITQSADFACINAGNCHNGEPLIIRNNTIYAKAGVTAASVGIEAYVDGTDQTSNGIICGNYIKGFAVSIFTAAGAGISTPLQTAYVKGNFVSGTLPYSNNSGTVTLEDNTTIV